MELVILNIAKALDSLIYRLFQLKSQTYGIYTEVLARIKFDLSDLTFTALVINAAVFHKTVIGSLLFLQLTNDLPNLLFK